MKQRFQELSPSSQRRVLTLIAMNLFNGSTAGVLGITLPLYTLALHGSSVDVGLTAAAQWIGVLGLSLPVAALLGGRLRWSSLFAAGAVVQAASLVALPFVRTGVLVPLVAVVNGVGRTLGHIPVASTLLAELAELGPQYAGWHRASFSVGLVLVGPFLGSAALSAAGPSVLFAAVAAATLVVGVAVAVEGEPERVARRFPVRVLIEEQVVALRRLLGRRELVSAFSVEGLVNAAVTVFAAFAPLLVTTTLRAPASLTAPVVAAEGAAYILTLTFGGPVLAALGAKKQYLVGAAIVSAGALFAASAPNVLSLLPAVVALGIGLGTISFATFAVLIAQPEHKGTVFSLFGMCMAGFVMAAPALAGLVGERYGVRAVFTAVAPVFALAGSLLAIGSRRRTETELAESEA